MAVAEEYHHYHKEKENRQKNNDTHALLTRVVQYQVRTFVGNYAAMA